MFKQANQICFFQLATGFLLVRGNNIRMSPPRGFLLIALAKASLE